MNVSEQLEFELVYDYVTENNINNYTTRKEVPVV